MQSRRTLQSNSKSASEEILHTSSSRTQILEDEDDMQFKSPYHQIKVKDKPNLRKTETQVYNKGEQNHNHLHESKVYKTLFNRRN